MIRKNFLYLIFHLPDNTVHTQNKKFTKELLEVSFIVEKLQEIINKLQAPRKILSVHISYCVLFIEIHENVDIVGRLHLVYLPDYLNAKRLKQH